MTDTPLKTFDEWTRRGHPKELEAEAVKELKAVYGGQIRVDVKCVDRRKEFRAADIAALGLDTRCRWYACKTGEHPAHKRCENKKP